MKSDPISVFNNSDLEKDLEDACCKLQGIIEGHVFARDINGKKVKLWGPWKYSLLEAYHHAQSVLDEIREYKENK